MLIPIILTKFTLTLLEYVPIHSNSTMKPVITSLFLIIGLVATASRPSITVTVKNQGNSKISYFESQGGMIIKWPVEPTLNPDSTFQITFPDSNSPEHVLFRFIKDDNYTLFPMYVTGDETLTIDGATMNIFTSSLPDGDVKAIETAREMENRYWDYLGGKDPLGLRKDSIPSSVYGKIMAIADSLTAFTKRSKALYPALRQDIMLNAYRFFREVQARHVRKTKNKQALDDWALKESEMEQNVDFQNPLNALSLSLLQLYPHAPEYSGDRTPESINRFITDYYRSFYSGPNAECLEASVIFADADQNKYAAGIPELYDEFRQRHPQSPLLPHLEKAVAKNVAVNSGMNDSDIEFVDSIASINSLIERFKGTPVLLDVWASWCGPCRKNFTQLEPLREFAEEVGLKLVYISIDEEADGQKTAKEIAKKLGVKGTHIIADKQLHQNVFDTFGNDKGIMMIPHIALYDAKGNLVVKGFAESENLPELIERLKYLLSPETPE